MKSIHFLTIILLLAIICKADSQPTDPDVQRVLTVANHLKAIQNIQPPIFPSPSGSSPTVTKDAVNYTIRVEWKDAKKGVSSIQLETTEGQFELDTLSGTTKINDSEVPNTIKLNGTLTELSTEKGRLQLFLGRTIPYITSTYAGSAGMESSSYSQLSVGLQSTFIVTFGKPLIVQTDDNGTVSILVKREDN
jgi:hypothetical protein